MDDGRIKHHPILEFGEGRVVRFTFDGKELTGVQGEPIACALHAAGVRVLRKSPNLKRPRGFLRYRKLFILFDDSGWTA